MRVRVEFVLFWLALAGGVSNAQTASPPDNSQFKVLDRVVAVIDGNVLLQSDVDEEMRFAALEPFAATGSDTRQDALDRLINRNLILEQMKLQQSSTAVPDTDAEKSLTEQRAHLPQCPNCATEDGWKDFLAAHDLTNQEVLDYWRQRLAILQFIDQRFRAGIRISRESIADYYAKSIVPKFEQQHEPAPALKDVSARIQELLLQQQVNGLLQDWLKSLRDEGSVKILDPAYASSEPSSGSATGEEE
jgi:peptidyl-prolyl cis-trans isomerase SurA